MVSVPGEARRSWTRVVFGPAPRLDLVAGLTVGAIVVPQSLAYAELARLPAVTGLYAALVAMAVYAVLGSSAQVSLGPTATSAILAAAAGSSLGLDGAGNATALAATALIAGGLAIASGLARLGFVANLLSRPVLAGYVAGAAVTIAVGQLAPLLGIRFSGAVANHEVVDVVRNLVGDLDRASATTVAAGVGAITALLLLRRCAPRVPAALVVVAAAVAASALLDLDQHGVAVMGEVPRGLPDLRWPDLPGDEARSLLAPAAALALVGFAETVGQARTFAARSRGASLGPGNGTVPAEVDANRELVALGAANLASGLTGGFSVSASFGRSAVSARAGSATRRAGAVAAGVVALTLLAFTGLFERLPRTTLAAVLIVAVVPLIPVRTFRRLYRLQRDDFVFAVAAAVGTLALGVLPGLVLAVALSIGGLLYRVTVADTVVLGYVPEQDTWRSLDRHTDAETAPGVAVLRLSGPLYFANVARFRHEVTELVAESSPHLTRLVVDGRAVSHLDVTALDTLADLHTALARAGVDLVLAGLRGSALDTFLRSDLVRQRGAHDLVFPTVRQAVAAAPRPPDAPTP